MILVLSVYVRNPGRPENRAYSRVEVFKYVLNSYRKLPFTELYFFIKLDAEFLAPGQYFHEKDLTEYLGEVFSHVDRDKIHVVLDRYTTQEKWKPFMLELMQKHGPNEAVWFMQNDDHVFIDFNTELLVEGLQHFEREGARHKTIYLSHWTEIIRLSGKLKNQTLQGNYVRFENSIVDSIQIFNLLFLYDIFVLYPWKREHIRIDSLDLIDPAALSSSNPLSQVIYVPLREMVRHFDGYDHVSMEQGACPALQLPSNTFQYSKDQLIKKMTAQHHSFWTSGNSFVIPPRWIEINLGLHHGVPEYTLPSH